MCYNSTSRPDLSILLICKTFSLEGIDAFYTHKSFLLDAATLDTTFETHPHAQLMTVVRPDNMEPIDIGDQRNITSLMAPIDRLAAYCPKLHTVALPCTVSMGKQDFTDVLETVPTSLGRHHGRFLDSRYPFALLLYNDVVIAVCKQIPRNRAPGNVARGAD